MYKSFFGCLVFLAFSFAAISQNSVVDWTYKAEKIGGNEFELVFTAEVQDGWYVYSQFLGDDGPIPTSFEMEGVELIGKGTEKGYKKEGYDEIFGMNLIKFGKTVTFTQRVKVASGANSINGYLTYMTCNDEQCLPPTDLDFEISL